MPIFHSFKRQMHIGFAIAFSFLLHSCFTFKPKFRDNQFLVNQNNEYTKPEKAETKSQRHLKRSSTKSTEENNISNDQGFMILAPNMVSDYFLNILDKQYGWTYDSAEKSNTSEFKKSFQTEYAQYQPTEELCNKLRYKLDSFYFNNMSIEIQIIGGNWCSDTKERIPKLAKILDKLGFLLNPQKEQLNYLRVDKVKNFIDTQTTTFSDFKINNPGFSVSRVPLIRISVAKSNSIKLITLETNGMTSVTDLNPKLEYKLLGEIVEFANPSWEQALLNILNSN